MQIFHFVALFVWIIATIGGVVLETLLIAASIAVARQRGSSVKLGAWFWAIQHASLGLSLVGVPICAVLAYGSLAHYGPDKHWHWPAWAWPWDNQEDGTAPEWYLAANPTWTLARCEFTWTAVRNPCNNLRYMRGVSQVGRPLWRKTWGAKPGGWYAQAGWNPSGFPVLSGGRNINPW